MSEAGHDPRLSRLLSAEVRNLERFVRCISHREIETLVKRSKHLQRRVFPGFRPNHLPWSLVPARLARDAAGKPMAVDTLLDLWLAEHGWLCKKVAESVAVASAEEDTARLLAELGDNQREPLFCALFLDMRPELHEILADGLQVALLERTPDFEQLAEQFVDELAKQAEGEDRDAALVEGSLLGEIANPTAEEPEAHGTATVPQGENGSSCCRRETENATDPVRTDDPGDTFEPTMVGPAGDAPAEEAACPIELPLTRLDQRWTMAIDAIAHHLGLQHHEASAPPWPTPSQDRWTDWQAWQGIEADLVSHLLDSPDSANEDRQTYLRRAQQLLVLRWYLLEVLHDLAGNHCSS
jgi:hypothetical protein